MYHLNPDLAKHYWVSSFNWGETEVITIGNGEYLMGHSIDRGNYRDHIGKGIAFWIEAGVQAVTALQNLFGRCMAWYQNCKYWS